MRLLLRVSPASLLLAMSLWTGGASGQDQKKEDKAIDVQPIDLKGMAFPFDGKLFGIRGKTMVEITTPEQLAKEFLKDE